MHHRANAQAGARAHHGQRAGSVRQYIGMGPQLRRPQARQGQGQRLEVVEHQQAVQAQGVLHRLA